MEFASLFDIIGQNNDATQALERIYSHRYGTEKCPYKTSLQKKAGQHKDALGFACGVILPEGAQSRSLSESTLME